MAFLVVAVILSLLSESHLKSLYLFDLTIYWKRKIDDDIIQLFSVGDIGKNSKNRSMGSYSSLEQLILMAQIVMLLISSSTFMFIRYLQSSMACLIIHHYSKHIYGTFYMYAPDWLTDLHENSNISRDGGWRGEALPELELDSRLERVNSTSGGTKTSPRTVRFDSHDVKKETDDNDDDDDDDNISKNLNSDESDPNRYIFDPQYGVVTIATRERWRRDDVARGGTGEGDAKGEFECDVEYADLINNKARATAATATTAAAGESSNEMNEMSMTTTTNKTKTKAKRKLPPVRFT